MHSHSFQGTELKLQVGRGRPGTGRGGVKIVGYSCGESGEGWSGQVVEGKNCGDAPTGGRRMGRGDQGRREGQWGWVVVVVVVV